MDPATLLSAVLIGVVEGLTEFLPISSTAHIRLTEWATGFRDQGETFAVVIQLGAILAVCVYFWRRLWAVTSTLHSDPASRRFALGLLIASLPVAVIGLKCHDWLEVNVFGAYELGIIAATAAVGGLIILAIERWRPSARHLDAAQLPLTTCLAIGFMQVLAMIPGVSRSGASIMGAMCIGVDRRAATEFSFFLAIPLMLGASGLKLYKHHDEVHGGFAVLIAVGFVMSFAVALAVVHWLLKWVATHNFRIFAWYRLAFGLVLALLLALKVIPLAVG
ncbi:MAG: undecaprenyl-diphosphate phosphatase [Planctomycetota bacterium]